MLQDLRLVVVPFERGRGRLEEPGESHATREIAVPPSSDHDADLGATA